MKNLIKKEAWKHSVKIGDVFRSSWGYQNTTVDYYEVVDLSTSGRSVYIRHLKKESHETETDQGYCVPMVGEFAFAYKMRRIVEGIDGNEFLRIFSFANAYKQTPVEIVQGIKVFKPTRWGIPTTTTSAFQISDLGR